MEGNKKNNNNNNNFKYKTYFKRKQAMILVKGQRVSGKKGKIDTIEN